MSANEPTVHGALNNRRRVYKARPEGEYCSMFLRRIYRQCGRDKHMSLAELAALPEHAGF